MRKLALFCALTLPFMGVSYAQRGGNPGTQAVALPTCPTVSSSTPTGSCPKDDYTCVVEDGNDRNLWRCEIASGASTWKQLTSAASGGGVTANSCPAGQQAEGIDASGNLTCSTDKTAATVCDGATTYLNGEAGCVDISTVYQGLDSDLTALAGGDWSGAAELDADGGVSGFVITPGNLAPSEEGRAPGEWPKVIAGGFEFRDSDEMLADIVTGQALDLEGFEIDGDRDGNPEVVFCVPDEDGDGTDFEIEDLQACENRVDDEGGTFFAVAGATYTASTTSNTYGWLELSSNVTFRMNGATVEVLTAGHSLARQIVTNEDHTSSGTDSGIRVYGPGTIDGGLNPGAANPGSNNTSMGVAWFYCTDCYAQNVYIKDTLHSCHYSKNSTRSGIRLSHLENCGEDSGSSFTQPCCYFFADNGTDNVEPFCEYNYCDGAGSVALNTRTEGGECSTTSSTICTVDADCPGGETCEDIEWVQRPRFVGNYVKDTSDACMNARGSKDGLWEDNTCVNTLNGVTLVDNGTITSGARDWSSERSTFGTLFKGNHFINLRGDAFNLGSFNDVVLKDNTVRGAEEGFVIRMPNRVEIDGIDMYDIEETFVEILDDTTWTQTGGAPNFVLNDFRFINGGHGGDGAGEFDAIAIDGPIHGARISNGYMRGHTARAIDSDFTNYGVTIQQLEIDQLYDRVYIVEEDTAGGDANYGIVGPRHLDLAYVTDASSVTDCDATASDGTDTETYCIYIEGTGWTVWDIANAAEGIYFDGNSDGGGWTLTDLTIKPRSFYTGSAWNSEHSIDMATGATQRDDVWMNHRYGQVTNWSDSPYINISATGARARFGATNLVGSNLFCLECNANPVVQLEAEDTCLFNLYTRRVWGSSSGIHTDNSPQQTGWGRHVPMLCSGDQDSDIFADILYDTAADAPDNGYCFSECEGGASDGSSCAEDADCTGGECLYTGVGAMARNTDTDTDHTNTIYVCERTASGASWVPLD